MGAAADYWVKVREGLVQLKRHSQEQVHKSEQDAHPSYRRDYSMVAAVALKRGGAQNERRAAANGMSTCILGK